MLLLPLFLGLLLVLLIHHHCILTVTHHLNGSLILVLHFMTPDSTQLSSLSFLDHSIVVQTADDLSLPVTRRGILSTSSFHVPTVSHVPNLTMQLMSVGQITDHGCRIILESDSCCVQDLRTGLLVGTGPRRHDPQRLWELEWLRLPSSTMANPSSTSPAPVVAASATAPTFA